MNMICEAWHARSGFGFDARRRRSLSDGGFRVSVRAIALCASRSQVGKRSRAIINRA